MTAADTYKAEMAKRGLTMAKATGCPREVVRPRLLPPINRTRGRIPDVSRAETRKKYQRYAELYAKGHSTPDIGRMMGASKTTVVRGLKQLGISLRAKGGPQFHVQRLKERVAHLLAENERLKALLSRQEAA